MKTEMYHISISTSPDPRRLTGLPAGTASTARTVGCGRVTKWAIAPAAVTMRQRREGTPTSARSASPLVALSPLPLISSCKLMQSLWRKSDLTIAACCCGAGLGTPNRGVEGGKLLSTGEAGEYNFIYDPEWFYSSDTARHP